MEHFINKLLEVFKTPIGWFSAIGAYFLPLKGVYELILAIVIFDFVTGLWASKINKIPCSSKRLRKSIYKLLGYLIIIWLFYKFEVEVGIQEWLCTYKLVAGFIFITEVISILENLALITNNKIFIKIIKLIRGKASDKDKVVGEILEEKNK
jgi:hypothetical protein